jgi:hypothetical protein
LGIYQFVAAVPAAQTEEIPMVAQVSEYVDLSTGLDSSGNIQHKGGSLDANWTVTGAVNPLNPPNAYVVDRSDADWGSWIGNGAYSSWIAANPFDATGNGLMTFTDTFDVATSSTATIIGGAWAIDDSGTLSLNGHVLSTLIGSAQEEGHLHAFSTPASDFVAGSNTLTMQITATDFNKEGGRLRGWLVGAGSAVGDPTSHIVAGATTNPSPTLSSLLPSVLGTETYTGDLAYDSDGVAQAPVYVDLSTGLDSLGNIQHKGGSLDANWTVTRAANPLDPPNAYVVGPHDADQGFSGGWILNGAYSSWIAANPFDAHGNGFMTFTRTFDVATPSTATIIGGLWTIDDYGTLSLNGHLISTLSVGMPWDHLHAFSTTAGDFVAGLNTLTMQVTRTDINLDGARLRGWLVGGG